MSDTWSLKGNEQILDERGLLHDPEDDDYNHYVYYGKSDIETLRQKLIEDLEKSLNAKDEEIDKEMKEFWEIQKRISSRDDSVGRYKAYHINNCLKAREIINKRFGVE